MKKSEAFSKGHVVEKRSEYHFAVLAPNPDAGKENVSYSGEWFTICTTDGLEEAKRIAMALNLLAASERVRDVTVVE